MLDWLQELTAPVGGIVPAAGLGFLVFFVVVPFVWGVLAEIFNIGKSEPEEPVDHTPSRSKVAAPPVAPDDIREATMGADTPYAFGSDASVSEKLSYVRERVEQVADRLGANVVERGGEYLDLQKLVDGRPFRTSFHVDAPWLPAPSFEMAIENRRGLLSLMYEEGAGPEAVDPDDLFTEESASARYFVEEELYLDTDFCEPRTYDELDFELRSALVELARESHYFHVLPEKIQSQYRHNLDEIDELATLIRRHERVYAGLAATFEGAEEWIGLEPGVYIDGERVEAGGIAPTLTCSYCGAVSKLDEHSQCPNCGAPLSA